MGTALATCAVGDAHASMQDKIVAGGWEHLRRTRLGFTFMPLFLPLSEFDDKDGGGGGGGEGRRPPISDSMLAIFNPSISARF